MDSTQHALLEKYGFGEQSRLVKLGRCPFCGETVNLSDLRDERSVREHELSGLCQLCQDEVYG